METIGAPELIIILVVVVLVFGTGRIGKLGGELGKSIREFRRGIQGDESPAKPAVAAGPAVDKPAAEDASPHLP